MKTDQILKLMKFLFWVIFIALCFNIGSLIYIFFKGKYVYLEGSKSIYVDSDLFEHSELRTTWYYISLPLIITLLTLKAYIAYLVTRIFAKIDFNNPFNITAAKLLTKISHVALTTGVLVVIANVLYMWINKKDLISILIKPYEEGSGEFLFLAGIIFIIAQIFKKGTKIQSENELTI